MSDQPKIPLEIAGLLAHSLVEKLAPYCDKIEIAGSIRRNKPEVGDIELVVIPKTEQVKTTLLGDTMTINHLWNYLNELLKEHKIRQVSYPSGRAGAWGDLHRIFQMKTVKGLIVTVDIWACTPENWGNTFVIRTGPAAFGHWLVTNQKKGGAMPDNLAQLGGFLAKDGKKIPCYTEQEFFNALGLDWVEPSARRPPKDWEK